MGTIVFGALHFSYFRNYDSVIRELAARGHRLHLMADQTEAMGGQQLVETLAAAWPDRVTWGFAPSVEGWEWSALSSWVRRNLEYVRFLSPYYDEIPKYRYRAKDRASRALVALFRLPFMNRAGVRMLVADALSRVEQAIPPPAVLVDDFRVRRPDAVILASATNPGAPQLDHLKAAMSIGSRSVVSVWSWDHLSGKAWLRLVPNRVLVWNDAQREEAVQLHGLPERSIGVTGAQCYDQWFGRSPSRPRETFFAAHGFDVEQDLLLYVCSVLVRPAPDEAPFVREWIEQVRASDDPRIRNANILIRPHPERLSEWEHVDLTGLGRVSVAGRNPVDQTSRDEYFDSLYHSRLVMGLVTSAFLEAAVVGRPVFTVMKPEFRLFQMGTPHFRYLITVAGGLLHTADDWPAHFAQLRGALDDECGERERVRRFVEAFVRPNGMEREATRDFADQIESVLAEPPQTLETAPLVAGRSVGAASILRTAIGLPILKLILSSPHDRETELAARERRERDAAAKAVHLRERDEREAHNQQERAEKLRQKEAIRREKARRVESRMRRTGRRRFTAAVQSRLRRLVGFVNSRGN